MTKREMRKVILEQAKKIDILRKDQDDTRRVMNARTRFMNKLSGIMGDLVIPAFEEIKADYNLAMEYHECECCLADAVSNRIASCTPMRLK